MFMVLYNKKETLHSKLPKHFEIKSKLYGKEKVRKQEKREEYISVLTYKY